MYSSSSKGGGCEQRTKRLLICMGLEGYTFMGDIAGAANDAKGVYEELKRHFEKSFLLCVEKMENSDKVQNSSKLWLGEGEEEALDISLDDKEGMLDAIERALEGLANDALVVFHYAGHGYGVDNKSLFVPRLASTPSRKDLLSLEDFQNYLRENSVKNVHMVCFLDSCREELVETSGDSESSESGGDCGGSRPSTTGQQQEEPANKLTKTIEYFLVQAALPEGLAAGDATGGFFTAALLHVLRHKACDPDLPCRIGSINGQNNDRPHVPKEVKKPPECVLEQDVHYLSVTVNACLESCFGRDLSPYNGLRSAQNAFLIDHHWRCQQLEEWIISTKREWDADDGSGAAKLSARKALSLSRLGLTSLPAEIDRLRSLEHLWLQGNQLTAFPKEIGTLSCLVTLVADDNKIQQLPSELAHCKKLRTLRLKGNCIYSVEHWLEDMLESLDLLDVSFNCLEDSAVDDLQKKTKGRLRCANQRPQYPQ